jgi:alpha-glucoside transport system permease protein
VNAVLTSWFSVDPIVFLGRADTVNYAIIAAYVWASTGFAMVVLSAALKGIPEEIIEAARTDGANEWAIFRRIQFPLLSLPMAVVTVWLTINVIKLFDVIWVLTRGGPGTSSEVIATQMYDELFQNGEGGYAASIAVVMLILILPLMVWNISRFRSERVVT